MHPNGQLPAYEWSFSDVNPPVHAWAALQVYDIDGRRDSDFLIRIFTKLLLNFSWWVNRKDMRRLEPVRGRLPRHGQHRPVRPIGRAAARVSGSRSPTPPAGWRSTACRCSRSRSSWPESTRCGTTSRPSSSSIFCRSRWRCGRSARPRCQPLGRRGRVLLRRARAPRRQLAADAGALDDRAAARSSPRPTRRRGSPTELPDFTSRLRWLMMRRPELLGRAADHDRRGHRGGRGRQLPALAARCGRAAPDPAPDVRRGRVPVTARHPLAVGGLPHRVHPGDRRRDALDRLRAGRIDQRAVRRQLELARADLVPGERAARRRVAHLRRLPRARRSASRCRPGRATR